MVPAPDHLHRALRPLLAAGLGAGLLPVRGVCGDTSGSLAFTWASARVLYSGLMAAASLSLAGAASLRLWRAGISLEGTAAPVFYLTHAIALLLLLQVSPHWPLLMQQWSHVQRSLDGLGHVEVTCRKLYVGVLLSGTVEHALATAVSVLEGYRVCPDDGLRQWAVCSFPGFEVVTFTLPRAALMAAFNAAATLAWNFVGVWVAAVSVVAAACIRRATDGVGRALSLPQGGSPGTWRALYERYMRVWTLTRSTDVIINKVTLAALGSNLYFVCLQLYKGLLLPDMPVIYTIYLCWSFCHVLMLTCVMCLLAARIHVLAAAPRADLYRVPMETYCVHVERYLQVTHDGLAFTAMGFFPITRTTLLTVLGTMVTYEVLLLQSHRDSVAALAGNSTVTCAGAA